jgi:hypothetical protein
MPDGSLQSDCASHRIAEEVGFLDAEVFDEGGHVVGHLLVCDRALDVGGASVSLQFDRDYLPGFGKHRDDLL